MKLLFIYNANSGALNALLDATHKLFSPSTYKCSLCALTYDTFTENTIWRTYRQESNFDMEFYHKDEFEIKFPNVNIMYPTVLKLESQHITTVLTTEILNEIKDVNTLINQLRANI